MSFGGFGRVKFRLKSVLRDAIAIAVTFKMPGILKFCLICGKPPGIILAMVPLAILPAMFYKIPPMLNETLLGFTITEPPLYIELMIGIEEEFKMPVGRKDGKTAKPPEDGLTGCPL